MKQELLEKIRREDIVSILSRYNMEERDRETLFKLMDVLSMQEAVVEDLRYIITLQEQYIDKLQQ